MKAISLFSGCGGDSLGMTNAGINVTHYSELKETFCLSHDDNLKHCTLIENDITKIKDEDFKNIKVDLIFAGFPCQSFSNGGKKNPDDPRGQLYKEFVRATKIIKPKYIIGENVKGLLTRKTNNDEKFLDIIISSFNEIGYSCIFKVFNTSKFNVPQVRERLIILGKRNDISKELEFPNELTNIPNLRNIIEFSLDGAIKVPDDMFDNIPEECIIKNINDKTLPDESNSHPFLIRKVQERDIIYNEKLFKYNISFGKRLSPNHAEIIDIRKPSKTIICTYDHQPRLFVPVQNFNGKFLRCLTVNELKQIQGFPKSYILHGNTKEQIIQIGNAVPPPLITHICNTLK